MTESQTTERPVRVPRRRAAALFWKEWCQLGVLRAVSIGLGLLLVLIALTAPVASELGWIPFAPGSAVDAATALFEVLPRILSLFLGPLVAILLSAQAHAGDRSTGHESFLLGLPVPRAAVWRARVLASVLSLVVVLAAAWGLWAAIVQLQGGMSPDRWQQAAEWAGIGVLGAFGCLLPGAFAGSMLSNPMAAVLLAIVLAGVPVYLASFLARWAEYATLWGRPAGVWAPVALVLGYPVASFLATCRGEPAGRGRMRRAGAVLVCAAVTTMATFVVMATLGVSKGARESLSHVVAGPGATSVIASSEARWIFDNASGSLGRFLAPPVSRARFDDDGRRLAIVTRSGSLGSVDDVERLVILDATGRVLAPPTHLSATQYVDDVVWHGDRILMLVVSERNTEELGTLEQALGTRLDYVYGLTVVDANTLERYDVPLPEATSIAELFASGPNGSVFVSIVVGHDEQDQSKWHLPRVHVQLYEIEMDGEGAPRFEPVLRYSRVRLHNVPASVSPSGRYVLGNAESDGSRPLLDRDRELATIDRLPGDAEDFGWLRGDVRWWTRNEQGRRSLVIGGVGQEAAFERSWIADGLEVSESPDDRRLLIVPLDRDNDDKRWRATAISIYDLETNALSELPQWPADYAQMEQTLQWAGPHTLALVQDGTLVIRSIEAPHEIHVVLEGK